MPKAAEVAPIVAATDKPTLVVTHGRGGTGKSTFVRVIAERAQDAGRAVVIADALTRLVTAETDVLLELISTQPTTEAGLRLKVNLMKQQIYTDIEDMDALEAFPFAVLNDCLKMLGQPTI